MKKQRVTHFLSVFAAIVILVPLCGCEAGEMAPDDSAPQSVLPTQSEVLPSRPEESQSLADMAKPAAGELVVTFEYTFSDMHSTKDRFVFIKKESKS